MAGLAVRSPGEAADLLLVLLLLATLLYTAVQIVARARRATEAGRVLRLQLRRDVCGLRVGFSCFVSRQPASRPPHSRLPDRLDTRRCTKLFTHPVRRAASLGNIL